MEKIRLKFFAAYREITGQGELDWPLRSGQTAASVLEDLIKEYPALSAGAGSALIMVNKHYAGRDTILQPGDEVAFLPPVGGGQA